MSETVALILVGGAVVVTAMIITGNLDVLWLLLLAVFFL